jgi:hypothetical protein
MIKSLLSILLPCLISSTLFVFALEGIVTFNQCMLFSLGLFSLINCAVTYSTQSRGLVIMTDVNSLMQGIDLSDLEDNKDE